MPWQDWVFSLGNIIFIAALIPSVISRDKPAFTTSLVSGGVLFCFSATYLTLGLILSAIFAFFNAIIWWVLAFQKNKTKTY